VKVRKTTIFIIDSPVWTSRDDRASTSPGDDREDLGADVARAVAGTWVITAAPAASRKFSARWSWSRNPTLSAALAYRGES